MKIKIEKSKVLPLYNIACKNWQIKITEMFKDQIFSEYFEFDSSLLDEIKLVCDIKQLAVFNSIFIDYLPKSIVDKVNNIESLAKYLNTSVKELLIYQNPSNNHERYINACNIIPKIVEVYNEGVILNWKNNNQYKYIPYKDFSSGGLVRVFLWTYSLYFAGGFYFKSKELAQSAYNNFKQYYEDYWNVK